MPFAEPDRLAPLRLSGPALFLFLSLLALPTFMTNLGKKTEAYDPAGVGRSEAATVS